MTKKVAQLIFVLFIILFLVIKNFHTDENVAVISDEVCEEFDERDSIQNVITHYRSWIEYNRNEGFCAQYELTDKAVQNSSSYRNELQVNNYSSDEDFWKQVYASLYVHDKNEFIQLQDSLQQMGQSLQLDRGEFARLIVAFVQDIPYNYIVPESCKDYSAHPCVPNAKFGILSPVEFLYSLHGDCDTRTVLLYTLLRNFGFDPMIINSNEYRHSMLALDIPASGDYFVYKGRKYSYWETTNVGWQPGMLPPDMNNKEYWTVALDYEFETNTAGVY
jgi:hypothetical protein